jgi:hypothetical protein
VRTPSWDEFREFLKHDDWDEDRATGHDFFEKSLTDGEILRTHASRSGSKTMSPSIAIPIRSSWPGDFSGTFAPHRFTGRFKAILSDQLRLSEAEFWEVLRTRTPAPRPSPAPEPAPTSLPLWLAQAVEREVGLTREQIAELDEIDARQRLDEARSRPKDWAWWQRLAVEP